MANDSLNCPFPFSIRTRRPLLLHATPPLRAFLVRDSSRLIKIIGMPLMRLLLLQPQLKNNNHHRSMQRMIIY